MLHDDAQRDEATESGTHNIHVYVGRALGIGLGPLPSDALGIGPV